MDAEGSYRDPPLGQPWEPDAAPAPNPEAEADADPSVPVPVPGAAGWLLKDCDREVSPEMS